MNAAASSGSRRPISISICPGNAATADPWSLEPRPRCGHEGGCRLSQLVLTQIQQNKEGLCGQEPEAAQDLHVLGVDLGQDLAERRLGFQRLPQPLHQRPFSLHRVALAPDDLLLLILDSLQPLLDGGQVAEEELELQRFDVPRRINRALAMRHVWIVERASDEHERIGLTQVTEQRPAHPFLGDAFGDASHVEILDISRDPLLRAEHFGQPIETSVRDFDRGEVGFVRIGGVGSSIGFRTGERVEDCRLAARWQADDDECCGHDERFPDSEPRSAGRSGQTCRSIAERRCSGLARGVFRTLCDVRDERVVAADDVRDLDAEQQVLLPAAPVRESQFRGRRIDNDRNRCRESERGNASRGITGHGNDISGICRARLLDHGGCVPADRGRCDVCR